MSSVRKLSARDEALLEAVLREDPYNNLFLLGDLLNLGMEHPDLDYWGTFDGDRLTGVLMCFRVNWGLCDVDGADFAAMAALLEGHPVPAQAITGEYERISRLWEGIRNYEATRDRRSHYTVLNALNRPAGVRAARRATEADLAGLMALFAVYTSSPRDEASVRRVLAMGRVFVADEDGTIVSSAQTTVEMPGLAMIGGVFTYPEKRRRGYSTACLTALCAELLSEGIHPCLFYDNPEAGSIYRRLGFEDIGTWRLLVVRAKAD